MHMGEINGSIHASEGLGLGILAIPRSPPEVSVCCTGVRPERTGGRRTETTTVEIIEMQEHVVTKITLIIIKLDFNLFKVI